MSDGQVFEHAATFEQGEVSGGVRLDRYEAHYEQLFAVALEDGVITDEERRELDRAAAAMGLDRERLAQLERALVAAYEARHGAARTRPAQFGIDDDALRPSIAPIEPATDQRTLALERRIAVLEARIAELERELEDARAQVQVEVDFSGLDATASAGDHDDPAEIARRLRHDPRDEGLLHALYRASGRQGDVDRQWCAAQVLVHLGAADADEAATYAKHRTDGLVRPTASVTADAWRRLLAHPEEESLTGDLFAVIAPAVLLGHVAALRHAGALVPLDPARRQNPAKSTLQAVRCFAWGASILGTPLPLLYADPERDTAAEMIAAVPPATRLGRGALSGRAPAELAFLAGRHLAFCREERFLRMLVPSVPDLEDLFLAALCIGNPGLPLRQEVKQRVTPIAKAIEPILEPAQVDRLRGHFLRFVEEGGRTNLQRWAAAADKTGLRAGMLLANDLGAAARMIALFGGAHGTAHVEEAADDLLAFVVSDRYAQLRKRIGIAITDPAA